jgi:predicted metalloprotease with PDZ domain
MNYDKRDFYIVPNSHFDEPFDYSYSGMELYLINGQILAGDVAKNSPAEKAGVKEGDIVVAVNKNFSQNMNQYKQLLQVADQKIQMVIKRDKELIEINFKIGSIL